MRALASQLSSPLLDALHGYVRSAFFADLSAGVTVGVIALLLARVSLFPAR